jgi:hypothetical protein
MGDGNPKPAAGMIPLARCCCAPSGRGSWGGRSRGCGPKGPHPGLSRCGPLGLQMGFWGGRIGGDVRGRREGRECVVIRIFIHR